MQPERAQPGQRLAGGARLDGRAVGLGGEGGGQRRQLLVAQHLVEDRLLLRPEVRLALDQRLGPLEVDVERTETLVGQLVDRVLEGLALGEAAVGRRVDALLEVGLGLREDQQVVADRRPRVVVEVELGVLVVALGLALLAEERFGGLVGVRDLRGTDEGGIVSGQVEDAEAELLAQPRLDVLLVALDLRVLVLGDRVVQQALEASSPKEGTSSTAPARCRPARPRAGRPPRRTRGCPSERRTPGPLSPPEEEEEEPHPATARATTKGITSRCKRMCRTLPACARTWSACRENLRGGMSNMRPGGWKVQPKCCVVGGSGLQLFGTSRSGGAGLLPLRLSGSTESPAFRSHAPCPSTASTTTRWTRRTGSRFRRRRVPSWPPASPCRSGSASRACRSGRRMRTPRSCSAPWRRSSRSARRSGTSSASSTRTRRRWSSTPRDASTCRRSSRRHAGIEREVTVVGAGDCLELWDAKSWDDDTGLIDRAAEHIQSIGHPA